MQLMKLELCGFKSFASRTEVVFNRGVTGIVGPNGCGKSNVVDAIKWVLGTLSYKSVRGEEMLDVIFKGAEGVPAMGFAEVSLTLENGDRTLPVEFAEVTITRRLFGTGEGEYSINRAPCRLKDIRELLYGTGIGTDNYSIIEQGKIDKLILSTPQERRLVFDEAAGISKYRARKRETEHRLEKVSQDLLRIQDVVHEVQKQLRSVRAQAGRAARFKEMQEEYRVLKTKGLIHEYQGLHARGSEIAERLRTLGEARERLGIDLGARAAELEEAQRGLEAEAARQVELSGRLSSLESQAGYLDRTLESSRARHGELEGELRRLDAQRSEAERREGELGGQIEAEERARAALDDRLGIRAEEANELRHRLGDAALECARMAGELEERKAEAVELAHKESQYRNERERLERDHADLESRAEASRARAGKLGVELGDLRARMAAARECRAAIEREIEALMERKKSEEAGQVRRRDERARMERDLVQLREGKDHRVARRETLRDLEEQYEGLETGAKALLRERTAGVLGTVADFLEVAPERVAAVEGALGERAGAVVCETLEHARGAAALIRERGLGRTVLIALDRCRNGGFSDAELLIRGAIGRASAWVTACPGFQEMVDALLGHTRVVQDAAVAEEIRAAGLSNDPLVTVEGDLFLQPGVRVTGNARAAQGLISRKAELRKLEVEIEEYLGLIAQREERQAELERALHEADEALEHLRQEVYEKNVAFGETATQIEQMSVREQFLEGEREALSGELEAIGRQAGAVFDRGKAVDSLLAELGWLRKQVEIEVAHLVETADKYERGRKELAEALEHARLECAKMGEQRLGLEKRMEMLRAARQEARGELERQAAGMAETRARREAAAEEIRGAVAEREALDRGVEEARSRLDEARQARESAADRVEAVRAAKGGLEIELGGCEEEFNGLRVEEGEHRVRSQSLADRAREDLEIDLVAAAASAGTEEGGDWEARGREAEELRIKIAGFGAVNVVALEQLQELEEREKFLLVQKEDLERSKGQLEGLIRQLNVESRALFEKILEVVREHFNTIFRKIFGGGKADLVLEQVEGVDPMEQGLEVMARPPAKELTAISLLSGGERTLTAIALVMALFKANPSPFCLLDEADAALDEKNVGRYAALVREFAADTQFIVITHDKRTMAVCDVLYGITMEQPGVSKKVSVTLSGDSGLEVVRTPSVLAVQTP